MARSLSPGSHFAIPSCHLTAKLGIIDLLSTLQPEPTLGIQHLVPSSGLPIGGDIGLEVCHDIIKALVGILEIIDLTELLFQSPMLLHDIYC